MVMASDRMTESPFVRYITNLKQAQFTGCLTVSNPDITTDYQLYFLLGRLLYATGGQHPVRRWWRHSNKVVTQLLPSTLQKLLEQAPPENLGDFWEYELLYHLRKQQIISPEQASQIVSGIVGEIFWGISCQPHWRYQCTNGLPSQKLQKQLALLDPLVILDRQQSAHPNSVVDLSRLSQAPVIRQVEKLKSVTSPGAFQTLSTLLDGEKTFWDLVLVTGRSPQEVLGSLHMQLESGIIETVPVHDLLPPPLMAANPAAPSTLLPAATATAKRPLIACVDDSAWVCQTLAELMKKADYRFVSIQDPLRAIPTLLSQKPDLILLDLRMPNTNGYEVCTQLRRLSAFSTVPILILTGNDGVVDRVRAKMVGATDFLSKTISHDQLLAALAKHLVKAE